MKRVAGCVVGWLMVSAMAQAQQAWVPIEQQLTPAQQAEIGLSPQQLALLNRYLGAARTDAVAAEAGRADGQQGRAEADRGGLLGFSDAPIESRLSGSFSGWAPGSVFTLENGQQWKVLKGSMRLRKPYDRTPVKVVPGLAGRWFLQVDEDLPKARVYRID